MTPRFPNRLLSLSAVTMGLLAGCGALTVALPKQDQWVHSFVLVDRSQNVGVRQGYASGITPTGTTLNYFFDTKALYLSRTWESLDVVASNPDPLPPGTTHQGAGDYEAGHVYDVAEHWRGCDAHNGPIFIVVFNSTTLQMEQSVEITQDLPEASGVAIDPGTGEAWVSSYCDPHHVYVYRMSDWALTGTIPLALPVPGNQGMSFRAGILYIAGKNGALYGLRLSDRSMRLLLHAPLLGEFEGIDFHGSELRWLVNRSRGISIVYGFAPLVDL